MLRHDILNSKLSDPPDATSTAKSIWDKFDTKYAAVEKRIFDNDQSNQTYSKKHLDISSQLNDALLKGDWADPVFTHPDLPYAARYLYENQFISFHQFCTIQERWETFPDFQHVQTYRILDHEGQFTNEALSHFVPYFNQFRFLNPLMDSEIDFLKSLIAALPASEQIFYLTQKVNFQINKTIVLVIACYDSAHSEQMQITIISSISAPVFLMRLASPTLVLMNISDQCIVSENKPLMKLMKVFSNMLELPH